MPAPRPHPDEIVVGPPPRERRRHELKMVGLFLLAALPVAAVLWLVVNPPVALLYVVAQTLFLWFGIRRRPSTVLRLSPAGLSYEPGSFQVRCAWGDVDALGPVEGAEGLHDSLVLAQGRLHWASDRSVRLEVEARGWDRIVPIGLFEPEWEWGQIGDAIRRWAPWVFELEPPDGPLP